MSEPTSNPPDAGDDAPDSARMRALLRGALAEPERVEPPELLGGVQRKIRQRSGGKFYGDAWSTSREDPTQTYLLTSLAMLVAVLVMAAALYSLAGESITVDNEPGPVQVLPPRR